MFYEYEPGNEQERKILTGKRKIKILDIRIVQSNKSSAEFVSIDFMTIEKEKSSILFCIRTANGTPCPNYDLNKILKACGIPGGNINLTTLKDKILQVELGGKNGYQVLISAAPVSSPASPPASPPPASPASDPAPPASPDGKKFNDDLPF